MSTAAAIRQMLAAGLTIDQALIAVEAMEHNAPSPAAIAPTLTARQARNARYYEKNSERLKASKASEIKTSKTLSDAPKTPPAPSPNGPSPSPAPQPHPLNPPTPHPAGKPAPATAAKSPDAFDRFWTAYPSRGEASNPKKPARDRFERAVKAGIDPEAIIAGAERYAAIETKRGMLRTDKIAQAVTWLNQQRWADYPEPVATVTPSSNGRVFVLQDSPQWWAWRDHRKAIGKPAPSASWNVERQADGWWFETEWPPGALDAKKAPADEPTPVDGMF